MADRVLRVNAFTTLDLVDGEAEGHGWRADAPAVANVTEDDGEVLLELELDNIDLPDVPAHADRLRLSGAQARELASALADAADDADGAD